MAKLKILHTSDWHYGLASWSESKKKERNGELERCIDFMLETAKREEVDMIIHAGDILDSITPPSAETNKYITKVFSEMGKIAPTFVILGNHDWKGLSAIGSFSSLGNVYIFDKFEEIEFDKFKFFAFPYLDKRKLMRSGEVAEIEGKADDMLRRFFEQINEKVSYDKPNILAVHGSIEGIFYVGEETLGSDLIINPKLFPSKIDYTALGHIHNGQKIENSPVAAYYSGAPIKCGFGEEKSSYGFIIAEIGEEGTKAEFIKTPIKEIETFEFSSSGQSFDDLKFEITQKCIEDKYYRVIVRGEAFPNYAYNEILEASENIVTVKLIKGDKGEAREVEEIEDLFDIKSQYENFAQFEGMPGSCVERFKKYLHEEEEKENG